MRAFTDQLKSPLAQVTFRYRERMYFGYPQDRILTLGARIQRMQVKDRKAYRDPTMQL
jgi:hypothetical protein